MRRTGVAVVLIAVVMAASGCDWVVRVSVGGRGVPTVSSGSDPSISATGRYVAFSSFSSNLVAGDDNRNLDVFVRDIASNRTQLVSRAATSVVGDDASFWPSISADGQLVVFASRADDLVAGEDGNGDRSDIFVRALGTATTVRVSVAIDGGDADGVSEQPSISPDGRFVAFVSNATNLVSGDANGASDVFVRDLQAGTTSRISVTPSGAGGDRQSGASASSFSADGRFVAFTSFATDLVANDDNDQLDVFVRDRRTESTVLASIAPDGQQTTDFSSAPSLSSDGRHLAFQTGSSSFVRDLGQATTTLVAADGSGPSLSGDGRYLTFTSDDPSLVPNDTNSVLDVFVLDRATGELTRASADVIGREGNHVSGGSEMSADGRYVAFSSASSNIDGGDAGNGEDVFVRAVPPVTVTFAAPSHVARGTSSTVTITGTNFRAGAHVSASLLRTSGVTVDAVDVASPASLVVSITVDADAPVGPRSLLVWNDGTGPGPLATSFGVCNACLEVT